MLLVVSSVAAGGPSRSADAAPSETAAYVPIGPVRLADTRATPCGCTRLDSNTIRVEIAGRADIPADIVAVAVTVTATPTATAGFVTTFPSRTARPLTSTLNTRPDRVTANSAIMPVGSDGAIELYHLVPGELIVDVTGVFVPAATAGAGRLVALPTSRLVDTREPSGGARPLKPNGDLTVPLPPDVATDATALVVNITSVLETRPGHLSVRPAGSAPTTTSFMNPNGSGQAAAASVIVPVSPDGFTIRSFAGGHVIVDVTGWFTGPSAANSTSGLFVPLTPTRLLDTREHDGRLFAGGTIEVPVPVDGAAAVVTNVTVTEADRAGFVAAFPAGTQRPPTSAVNPGFWNHTVANTAITRVSTRGLSYFSLGGTDLVVDLSGWFVGEPVAATRPVAANEPTLSRGLLVGDSTLAALDVHTDALVALRGFDAVVDAESCRRLVRPSCRSDSTGQIPNTAVQAILGTPGHLDVVVVKAGYNDWFSDFPAEFDAVVQAARAKGAHTVVWFTQNENVSRSNARRAYQENNADLRWLTSLPRYSDVVLADWLAYSNPRPDWFYDGTHVGRAGAYAIADFAARWIAALEHRPCPRPWVLGGPIFDPCPPPELVGPVPDPIGVGK
jgi:hypothetical protein